MDTRVKKSRGLGVWFFLAIFLLLWGNLVGAADDVKIKILAVNPSETQTLKTVVTQGLPPEIDPTTDILDKAGLEVQYDTKKKTYYLTKEVELQPKQTLTFELRVRDVWRVDPEAIDEVKKNLEEQIDGLAGTKYAETGGLLYEKAQENLDRIIEEQNQKLGINQHIELYRAHMQQLEDIRNNAFSLEAMRRLEEEKKKGVQEARFVIEAENPASESKEITISSLLPKEIKAEDVIDRQGFNILYDESRKVYFLEKREMFDARQNKKYTIVLKDIWRIPEQDINYYKEQATKFRKFFEDTPYLKYAKEQLDVIMRMLGEVLQLQGEVADSTSLEERMRAYVLNLQKMNVVKGKLHDLQQLLPEIGLEKPQDFLTRIKYWVKQLVEVKDAVLISIGLEPDTPMTWWIIFGIVLFLGIVSTVFYVVWLKKLQESRWQEREKTKSPFPGAAAPKSQGEKDENNTQTVSKE